MTGPARRGVFGAGLAVAGVVLVADQISKVAILRLFDVAEGCRTVFDPVILTPFLNLILACNPGISFGFLPASSTAMVWALIALALAIVGGLLVWLWRINRVVPAVSIGLVIGGALGNVVDRVRFHSVVDFVDFHVGGWHFATFNVADAGISVGVALLLLDSLFGPSESPKKG